MKKADQHSFSRDANGQPILGVGNSFQAIDATGTPNKSPLAVSSSVISIVPPKGAIKMVAYALTNPIRVSDESTAADHYYTLQTSQAPTVFDIANEQTIYVLRDGASDGTLHFFFVYI